MAIGVVKPAAAQDIHLIVIVGAGGDEEHSARFHKWASAIVEAAKKRGVSDAAYLGEKQDPSVNARATKENVTKAFQDAAGYVGDDVDGVYGPATRGALIFYGVPNPPPALFGSGTKPYVPPTVPADVAPPPTEEPAPPVVQPRSSAGWLGIVGVTAATGLVIWWLGARRRR